MIIDDITNYQRYQELDDLAQALEIMYDIYQSKNFPTDNQELSARSKINSVSFMSRLPEEDEQFENHRQWLDIHFIFNGSEEILVGSASQMEVQQAYDQSQDIEFLRGTETVKVTLEAGQFLICYPGEAHCVGVSGNPEQAVPISKLVGKIKMTD
ncbi:YhcH/YjgK/YiaL family protein [Vagococcus salmoninarum]|uniref:YhcH/YjgK/YiaL family protein n=1 Tax=Vagococcus salmoninarum TaxID=2739 RepID=UPI00187E64BD|nr:YhcH/YjgK/YiaL family protein [Vagococcus salmoninarum]MBE9389751.1 YhcH/YjgK/YiaL family protein [Vagococcus salmoninarum]